MAVLPAFGERTVPIRVRLGVGFAFTIVVAASISEDLARVPSEPSAWLLVTETFSGLSIGIAIRFFIFSLQIAGSIAAQSTSLSQLFGGATVEPLPAVGHLLVIAGLALAAGLGLHIKLVELFLLSYRVLPMGLLPDRTLWANWELQNVSRMFGLAFALAAPFVAASFLYNIAMGVINRAMPQLMVAFIGAPAITAGGLVLLALATPFLLSLWLQALDLYLISPFKGF